MHAGRERVGGEIGHHKGTIAVVGRGKRDTLAIAGITVPPIFTEQHGSSIGSLFGDQDLPIERRRPLPTIVQPYPQRVHAGRERVGGEIGHHKGTIAVVGRGKRDTLAIAGVAVPPIFTEQYGSSFGSLLGNQNLLIECRRPLPVIIHAVAERVHAGSQAVGPEIERQGGFGPVVGGGCREPLTIARVGIPPIFAEQRIVLCRRGNHHLAQYRRRPSPTILHAHTQQMHARREAVGRHLHLRLIALFGRCKSNGTAIAGIGVPKIFALISPSRHSRHQQYQNHEAAQQRPTGLAGPVIHFG